MELPLAAAEKNEAFRDFVDTRITTVPIPARFAFL
jgi:hypothetical protein